MKQFRFINLWQYGEKEINFISFSISWGKSHFKVYFLLFGVGFIFYPYLGYIKHNPTKYRAR